MGRHDQYRSDEEDEEEGSSSSMEAEATTPRSAASASAAAAAAMTSVNQEYQALLTLQRPKRQRTSTTFYTDENPSTHTYPTAKVKREEEAAARAAEESMPPPPSARKKSSSSSSSKRRSSGGSVTSQASRPSPPKRSSSASSANKSKPSAVISSPSASEYARPYNRSPTSSRRRDSTSSLGSFAATASSVHSDSKRSRGRPGRKRKLPITSTSSRWENGEASHSNSNSNGHSGSSSSANTNGKSKRTAQHAPAASAIMGGTHVSKSGKKSSNRSRSEPPTKRPSSQKKQKASTVPIPDHSASVASPSSSSVTSSSQRRPKRRGRPPAKYLHLLKDTAADDFASDQHASGQHAQHRPQHQHASGQHQSVTSPAGSFQPSHTAAACSKPAASSKKQASQQQQKQRKLYSNGTGISHATRVRPILPTFVQYPTETLHQQQQQQQQTSRNSASSLHATTPSAATPASSSLSSSLPPPNGVPKTPTQQPPSARNAASAVSIAAALEKAHPNIFRRSVGAVQDLGKPEWDDIYEPSMYYNRDYGGGSGGDDNSLNEQSDDDMNQQLFQETNEPCSPSAQHPSRRRNRRLKTLDMDIPPVHRSVSCLTMRAPNNDYMAVGDTAGFVTIYAMHPVQRPVQRLESVACSEDRSYAQQQTIRQQLQNKKKVRLKDTPQTTIKAMSMVRSRIVLATACELECMDIPSASSLWVFPFDPARRQVVSLDMHPTTYDVLVSCRMSKPNKGGTSGDSDDSSSVTMPGPISPMLVLKHAYGNVEICDANSPSLVKSPFCTAIWDRSVASTSADESSTQLLLCSPMADETNDWKLILLQGGSIDQWKVKTKTKIPSATGGSSSTNNSSSSNNNNHIVSVPKVSDNDDDDDDDDKLSSELKVASGGATVAATKTPASSSTSGQSAIMTLRQSRKGRYTFVASARGIRLFETETLSLLHVYGDQLALHGRSIVWQDVVVMGKAPTQQYAKRHGANKQRFHSVGSKDSCMVECEDALAVWNTPKVGSHNSNRNDDDDDEEDILGQFIIGVPHPTKGPKELCEALHVWNSAHATSVPLLHLPLPELSDGVQSLVTSTNSSPISANTGFGDCLVLATQRGACHQWVPNFQSDFAGVMYPPGYQTLCDNIEYIEDEDELDKPTTESAESARSAPWERTNMHLQQLRQYSKDDGDDDDGDENQDEDVDVVDIMAENASDDDDYIIPCRPEPYLRQLVNRMDEGDNKKPGNANDDANKSNFFTTMLDILPQKEPAPEPQKPSSLNAETITFTTITLVAADVKSNNGSENPSSRPNSSRGRRSRSSNLKAMVKASIDPRLQAYMTSPQTQLCRGEGSDFVLPEIVVEETTTTMTTTKEDAPPTATASAATTDQLRVVSDSSEANTDGNETTSAAASVVVPTTVPEEAKPPATLSDEKAETKTPGKSAKTSEETAIFALLGLSPCNVMSPSENKTTADAPTAGDGTAASAANDGDAAAALQPTVSTAPAPVDVQKPAIQVQEKKPISNCAACMGRMVMHSCGKRALPIDYDEVIRKERIRREKEEEERKRIQKEKRRLADARRREARKQKMREIEERKRIQKENERIEKERRRRLDMASYEASSNYVDDRNREMSYSYDSRYQQTAYGEGYSSSHAATADHSYVAEIEVQPPPQQQRTLYDDPHDAVYHDGQQVHVSSERRSYVQMPAAQTFVQHLSSASATAPAPPPPQRTQDRSYSMLEHRQYTTSAYAQAPSPPPAASHTKSHDATPASWSKASITGTSDEATAQYARVAPAPSSYGSTSPQQQPKAASKQYRSSSVGMLSSAEGLAALASLAGQPGGFDSDSAATPHHPPASFEAAQSGGIPSYESIRSEQQQRSTPQMNGGMGFVQGYKHAEHNGNGSNNRTGYQLN